MDSKLFSRRLKLSPVEFVRVSDISGSHSFFAELTERLGFEVVVSSPPKLGAESVLDFLEISPLIVHRQSGKIQVIGNLTGFFCALDSLPSDALVPVRELHARSGAKLIRAVFNEIVTASMIHGSASSNPECVRQVWNYLVSQYPGAFAGDIKAAAPGKSEFARLLRIDRRKLK